MRFRVAEGLRTKWLDDRNCDLDLLADGGAMRQQHLRSCILGSLVDEEITVYYMYTVLRSQPVVYSQYTTRIT